MSPVEPSHPMDSSVASAGSILEERPTEISDQPVPPLPPRRAGIGFVEASCWVLGLHISQLAAGLATSAALAGWYIWNGGTIDSQLTLIDLGREHLSEILSGAQLGTVLFALWAVLWRAPRISSTPVGWQFPGWSNVGAIVVLAVPLSVLCSSAQWLASRWAPDSGQQMAQMLEGLKSASFMTLLSAIAIAPALAEEFVFRAVIARGLVARRGVVAGVVATALLFAFAHFNLTQAMGVLPMGLALHYVYWATRSIWGPVLLHFLNNSLAVVLLTIAPQAAQQLEGQTGPDAQLLIVSAAVVLGVALLLREMRTRQDGPTPPTDEAAVSMSGKKAAMMSAVAVEPARLAWITVGLVFNGLGFLAVLSRSLS